jgi:RNA polymerase sigma-70 factor (ECF subfamily)
MGDEVEVSRVVARAKAGDSQAFDELYDRYAGRVYRYALARVAEPADAEDLLQRVFLKVIEALPRYEDRGVPFGAWLFRIARNAVVDQGRVPQPTTTLDAALGHVDGAHGPDRLAELAADRAVVRAALSELTPEQREVVLYRFFAGLSPREIGLLMGKREGTIRALQFRALATLRRKLGAEELPFGLVMEEGS